MLLLSKYLSVYIYIYVLEYICKYLDCIPIFPLINVNKDPKTTRFNLNFLFSQDLLLSGGPYKGTERKPI